MQPGVTIDYATGESRADTDADEEAGQEAEYVLNTRSKKFHLPDCASVDDISESNKEYYEGTQDELLAQAIQPAVSAWDGSSPRAQGLPTGSGYGILKT